MRVLLCSLALFFLAQPSLVQAQQLTAAVVGEEGLEPLAEMIQEGLAAEPSIALLERSQVEAILREQGTAVSGMGIQRAVDLGNLAKARAIVYLSGSLEKGVAIRILDVGSSLISWQQLTSAGLNVDKQTQELEGIRRKLASQLSQMASVRQPLLKISIPAPKVRFLGNDASDFVSAYHNLLLHEFAQRPDIAVVERHALEALAWEGALSGNIIDPHAVSLTIESELSHPASDPNSVQLTIRVVNRGKTTDTLEIIGSRSNPSDLAQNAARKALATLSRPAPETQYDPEEARALEAKKWAKEALAARGRNYDTRYVREKAAAAWFLGHRSLPLVLLRAETMLVEATGVSTGPTSQYREVKKGFRSKPDGIRKSLVRATEALELLVNEVPPLEKYKDYKTGEKKYRGHPWWDSALPQAKLAHDLLLVASLNYADQGLSTELSNLKTALVQLCDLMARHEMYFTTRDKLAQFQLNSAPYWGNSPKEVSEIQCRAIKRYAKTSRSYDSFQKKKLIEAVLIPDQTPGSTGLAKLGEDACPHHGETILFVFATGEGPEAFESVLPQTLAMLSELEDETLKTLAEGIRYERDPNGRNEATFWPLFERALEQGYSAEWKDSQAIWEDAFALDAHRAELALMAQLEKEAAVEDLDWKTFLELTQFLAPRVSQDNALRILHVVEEVRSPSHPYWEWATKHNQGLPQFIMEADGKLGRDLSKELKLMANRFPEIEAPADIRTATPDDESGGVVRLNRIKPSGWKTFSDSGQHWELQSASKKSAWFVRRPDFAVVRWDPKATSHRKYAGPARLKEVEREALHRAEFLTANTDYAVFGVHGDYLPWRRLLLDLHTGNWLTIGDLPPLDIRGSYGACTLTGRFLYSQYRDPGKNNAEGTLRVDLKTGQVRLLCNTAAQPGSEVRVAPGKNIVTDKEGRMFTSHRKHRAFFHEKRSVWLPATRKDMEQTTSIFGRRPTNDWLIAKRSDSLKRAAENHVRNRNLSGVLPTLSASNALNILMFNNPYNSGPSPKIKLLEIELPDLEARYKCRVIGEYLLLHLYNSPNTPEEQFAFIPLEKVNGLAQAFGRPQ